MPKGGARPGAGRKPKKDAKTTRGIRFSPAEWEQIQRNAEKENMTASDYVRKKALGQ